MFCSNCGKESSSISKFCRFCGTVQTNQQTKDSQTYIIEEKLTKDKDFGYAGFWIRLGAFIVDYSLLILIFAFISVIIGAELYDSIIVKNDPFATYITLVLYSIFFLSTWSKTPGKALYNLKVIKEIDKQNLSLGVAIKRSLLQIISLLFFGIGYWNMGADEKKRTFHDKHAGTVVIKESQKSLVLPILITIIGAALLIYFYSLGVQSTIEP